MLHQSWCVPVTAAIMSGVIPSRILLDLRTTSNMYVLPDIAAKNRGDGLGHDPITNLLQINSTTSCLYALIADMRIRSAYAVNLFG